MTDLNAKHKLCLLCFLQLVISFTFAAVRAVRAGAESTEFFGSSARNNQQWKQWKYLRDVPRRIPNLTDLTDLTRLNQGLNDGTPTDELQ